MNEKASEYRAKIEAAREKGGIRWRTPSGLRQEIVAWASKQRLEGQSTDAIAESIGLSSSALHRWLSPKAGPGELRRVRVGSQESRSPSDSLAVVTPSGHRLEGLSVDQAVDVLRRL